MQGLSHVSSRTVMIGHVVEPTRTVQVSDGPVAEANMLGARDGGHEDAHPRLIQRDQIVALEAGYATLRREREAMRASYDDLAKRYDDLSKRFVLEKEHCETLIQTVDELSDALIELRSSTSWRVGKAMVLPLGVIKKALK